MLHNTHNVSAFKKNIHILSVPSGLIIFWHNYNRNRYQRVMNFGLYLVLKLFPLTISFQKHGNSFL